MRGLIDEDTPPEEFPSDVYVDIDYVRIYQQRPLEDLPQRTTCNPDLLPTKSIIEAQRDLYYWPNELVAEKQSDEPADGPPSDANNNDNSFLS